MTPDIRKWYPGAVRVKVKAGRRVDCPHPERMAWWRHYYKGCPLYDCRGCPIHCGRAMPAESDPFEEMPEQLALF